MFSAIKYEFRVFGNSVGGHGFIVCLCVRALSEEKRGKGVRVDMEVEVQVGVHAYQSMNACFDTVRFCARVRARCVVYIWE